MERYTLWRNVENRGWLAISGPLDYPDARMIADTQNAFDKIEGKAGNNYILLAEGDWPLAPIDPAPVEFAIEYIFIGSWRSWRHYHVDQEFEFDPTRPRLGKWAVLCSITDAIVLDQLTVAPYTTVVLHGTTLSPYVASALKAEAWARIGKAKAIYDKN